MPTYTHRAKAYAQTTCSCPACAGLECLERPRYFAGMLLTEAELNSAQSYVLDKQRLHNRYLHGWGVVCGLQVVAHASRGWVTVKQGYAIDACGNDVVVCANHDFDVLRRIRECRAAERRRADCDPLRPGREPPPPDVEERWCLTLAYQEQEARPTTALRQEQGASGGNGGVCGCAGAKPASSVYARSPARAQSGVGQTVAPCESTRIVEGYRLDVVPAPPVGKPSDAAAPGTLRYELERCRDDIGRLMAQAPQVDAMGSREAYQACRRYHEMVRAFLRKATVARGTLLDRLDALECPVAAMIEPLHDYRERVKRSIRELVDLLGSYLADCLCMALLPSCPAAPSEDRLILACLTIRGDKIVEICHYDGRRQLIGFPALEYWLSILPVGSTLSSFLQAMCCDEPSWLANLFGWAPSPPGRRSLLTTGGLSNPGMLQEMLAETLGQILGVDIARRLVPDRSFPDLDPRSLIGSTQQKAGDSLREKGIDFVFEPQTLWWTRESEAMAASYAPAVVATGDKLILYVSGDRVVGVDVMNETQRLSREVVLLNNQVAALKKKVAALEKPKG